MTSVLTVQSDAMSQGFPMMPNMMMQQMQMQMPGNYIGMGMPGMGGMNTGMGHDGSFGNWGPPNGGVGSNNWPRGPRNLRGNSGRGRGPRNNRYFTQNSMHAQQTSTAAPREQKPETEVKSVKAREGGTSTADTAGKDLLKRYSITHYAQKNRGKDAAQAVPDDKRNDDSPVQDADNDARPPSSVIPDAPSEAANAIDNDDVPSDLLTEQEPNQVHKEDAGPADLGPNVPQGPAAQFAAPFHVRGRGRGVHRGYRGGYLDGGRGGRGGSMHGNAIPVSSVEPAGVGVVGAPTGPKALREGGPNIGFRGRANTYFNPRGGRGAAFGARNAALTPTAV